MSEKPVMKVPVRKKSPYYEVVIDRDLDLCGETRLPTPGTYEPGRIMLRQWDEEVFLHECLHAILHEGELTSRRPEVESHVSANEEQLVAHLSHALHEMGWRFMWPHQGGTSGPEVSS